MAIRKIWLCPPLSIARVGGSSNPLEAFFWGPNDETPSGTGQTTILPAETLVVDPDHHTLSATMPKGPLRFKDNGRFRPVCPFIELHGQWGEDQGDKGHPITVDVLAEHGLLPSDIEWKIVVANLKAFHMSQDLGARIDASLSLAGDQAGRYELNGVSPSPKDVAEPLIPEGKSIPLGAVHVIRPTADFPEIRIRFYPGKGLFYGPTGLQRRWDVRLPSENLFLNPRSPWCRWSPTKDDPRGEPGGQYAQDENAISYGMVDDICDGIVTCSIPSLGLSAYSRVVSGPPDYAPDRRPFVSFADGLKDRTSREEVADPHGEYFDHEDACDAEILDLMERVCETVSLANVDYLNSKAHSTNAEYENLLGQEAEDDGTKAAFEIEPPIKDIPLPLTDRGRHFHRRLANITVLKDILRKRPHLFEDAVRRPFDTSPFYNRRMPLGMSGADGGPLTLTARQYELFKGWVARLHKDDPKHGKDKS